MGFLLPPYLCKFLFTIKKNTSVNILIDLDHQSGEREAGEQLTSDVATVMGFEATQTWTQVPALMPKGLGPVLHFLSSPLHGANRV